ncbi:hypothetical protein JCM15519_15780 [Fundidesulfovibrio butyratiphilus]
MTKYSPWLAGAAIFFTGAVVGALLLLVLARPMEPFKRPPHKPMPVMVLDHMQHDLDLSKEQVSELKPVVEEMVEKLHEARKPFQKAEEAIFTEYQAKIAQHLTPDQRRKQEELIARMKKMRDAGFPPPPDDRFGPPPPPPGGGPLPLGPLGGPPPGPPDGEFGPGPRP